MQEETPGISEQMLQWTRGGGSLPCSSHSAGAWCALSQPACEQSQPAALATTSRRHPCNHLSVGCKVVCHTAYLPVAAWPGWPIEAHLMQPVQLCVVPLVMVMGLGAWGQQQQQLAVVVGVLMLLAWEQQHHQQRHQRR